jgi:hypothetical protein
VGGFKRGSWVVKVADGDIGRVVNGDRPKVFGMLRAKDTARGNARSSQSSPCLALVSPFIAASPIQSGYWAGKRPGRILGKQLYFKNPMHPLAKFQEVTA